MGSLVGELTPKGEVNLEGVKHFNPKFYHQATKENKYA